MSVRGNPERRSKPGRSARGRAAVKAGTIRLLVLPLILTILFPARASAPPMTNLPPKKVANVTAIDSLIRQARFDSALARSSLLLPQVRAANDSAFMLPLLVVNGNALIGLGRVREAESSLREAVFLIDALEDSTWLCPALRWLSVAVGAQDRPVEARDLAGRLRAVARVRGDQLHEGWGLVGLAYDDEIHGRPDEAANRYRQATALFEESGARDGAAWALNGLGKVSSNIGKYKESLDCYRRVAVLAREINNPMMESAALNNLGTLAFSLGDPGEALEHFRRAHELQLRIGNPRQAVVPAVNIALCERKLGRLADAAQRLEELQQQCKENDDLRQLGIVVAGLAHTRNLQNRHRKAAALFRETLTLGDALRLNNRVDALIGLSRSLNQADSVAASVAVLEEALRLVQGFPNAEAQIMVEQHLGELLLFADRLEESLDHSLRAVREARRLGVKRHRLEAMSRAARAWRLLGSPDSALTVLTEAAEFWDSLRTVPLDPEWREQRGASGRMVNADLASLLLDHPPDLPIDERIAAAYNQLQPFKARTLMERMLGPGEALTAATESGLPDPATLEKLQAEVLAEEELLLDCFLGHDQLFLFAVTREECRVVHLPSTEELGMKLRLYHELLSTPDAADPLAHAELRARSCAHLNRLLLGELADLIESSRRVLVSPDGPLNLIPFGQLSFEQGNERSGTDVPPGDPDQREWVRVPSATILAWQRECSPPPDPIPGVQVFALAARETESGETLAGALSEVRNLRRRYANVDANVVSAGDDSLPELDILGSCDVIHLAAHAQVNDQYPWHSTIRLSPDNRAGDLRADKIAGMHLPARLAVLSGCESARGRILSGEGVQGLGGAFLSAGVPAVVATLWPVDDEATTTLMKSFYEELANGNDAASSLRRAQMTLQRDQRTADPFFWAGFVLIGDGGVRVPLEKRRNLQWVILLGALLLVVSVAGLSVRNMASRRAGEENGRRKSQIPCDSTPE